MGSMASTLPTRSLAPVPGVPWFGTLGASCMAWPMAWPV